MSIFHQIKNIFTSSNHHTAGGYHHDRHSSNGNKSNKYEDAATKIIKQESITKSKVPVYQELIGTKYNLIKKLGEGAFSNVYKAIDKRSDQFVAIKIVRKFELSQIQKASVLKEVQIMRTLNHTSITKMLDFIESQEHYFLILELMDGGEIFHQIVQLTYFSEDLSRHCIQQVAEGIRYLHEERGVVHRDIKPENILFTSIPFMDRKSSPLPTQLQDDEPKVDEGEFVAGLGGGCIGQVKIADFGLSKVVWDKQTMTPCGTVGYTAPEIVRDERYSKSVDMWALGCVLYTMLSGFPPFYDESISTLTQKVARGKYEFLSPWWDHISEDAKDLVKHVLEVNPKKRYTIDQFLAHPWLSKQDTPVAVASATEVSTTTTTTTTTTEEEKKHNQQDDEKSIVSPRERSILSPDDLLIPASITTSVAVETVSMTTSPPPNTIRPSSSNSHKRKDIFLSGIASMKEAFDVTYAVHRIGEERAQRKELKKLQNASVPKNRFIKALNAPLEEEDLYYHDIMNDSDDRTTSTTSSLSLTSTEEEHERHIADLDAVAEGEEEQTEERKKPISLIKKLAGGFQQQQHHHDSSPPIVNQRVKKSFDLNLNNATLLGRRKNVTPVVV